MKFAKFAFLAVTLSVGLSACGSVDSLKVWQKKKPEPCPRITVLRNASELTKFKPGPGRDLIDILYEAKITNVFSKCEYDVDYDTRAGTIHTQIAPMILAKRGPADEKRLAELEYFVAMVDEEKNILQKNVFPLKLGFPGNLTQNEVRDEPIDLTLVTDGNSDGGDYEVYIGFQLTQEELSYNERLKGR